MPIEKVMVWDGGGESGGVKGDLGKRLMGALPPMHELARMAGLELPEYLGKAVKDDDLPKDNEAVAKAREALRNKIEQALDKQEGEQDTDSKPSDES
ncbi:MAG: hypothetical protein U5N86_08295 [Planctomycetota bacterium]|nr:hypothetical protein [Planctomycetota bacterium]